MAAEKGNRYAANRKINPTYTEEQIVELAADMVDWAETSKDIHLAGWALKHNKSPCWFNYLVDNYPLLKEAKEEAEALLGRKILNLSFYDKEVNAYVGMKYLSRYDKDYLALVKVLAEMNKVSQPQAQNQGTVNKILEQELNGSIQS